MKRSNSYNDIIYSLIIDFATRGRYCQRLLGLALATHGKMKGIFHERAF